MSDLWYDEIGRMYCNDHRRESCEVCGMECGIMNRMIEVEKGIRKPPSVAEKLAEERVTLRAGIKFMLDNPKLCESGNMKFHKDRLKVVEEKISSLRASGAGEDTDRAIRAAEAVQQGRDAERNAVASAWARQNPGKSHMEWGGLETQALFDQYAAPPPSATSPRADKLTCGYCGESSVGKLRVCAACKVVYYCSRECQVASWKGHKLLCKPVAASQAKGPPLPLTWAQLEAFHGQPAVGKVLEVRAMTRVPYTRQIMQCKDRLGAVKIVVAYTSSGVIPGLSEGTVMRWRNPRFNVFLDGQTGARIEDDDLCNIETS